MPSSEPRTSLSAESWIALLTSFVILTVAFAFGLFCWPAVYRPLVRQFHWTFANANAGGAIALLMIGILSPLVGSLVDRFRPKPVILGGTLLVAGALALLSTIQSLPQYYAYCAVLGIGASAVSILPTSILIGPAFSQWRGLAVGVINAGIGLGGYIAPRLATAQIAKRGIPGMFLVLAACMAIPLAMTLLLVRNRESAKPAESGARPPTARELARMPMFWVFGLGLFFTAHAMLGVQQNLISYLTGEKLSAAQAASILAIALAAAAPGKLISGWLADKVSARGGMIFSVVCVALGILALLNTAPQAGTMMYALAIVFGMGYGGIFNATPTIVFEYFGTHRVGNAMGLFYVFFGLGTASGGELAGHIFDETHRWASSFSLDLALACGALLLMLASGRVTSRGRIAAKPALSAS